MSRKFSQQQVNKRKNEIIAAGLRLASRQGGWVSLTATSVAAEAGCSYGLVALYLGSMSALRNTLVRTAVKRGNYAVLAQALVAGYPEAQKMPSSVRAKVIAHISSGE